MEVNSPLRVCLFLFVAITLLGLSRTCKADDSYVLYKIPRGHRVSVAGELYEGFTLDERKQLLLVDSSLRTAENTVSLQLKEIGELKLSLDNLRTASALDGKEIALLHVEVDRKDKLLTEAVKKSIELQNELTVRKRMLRIGTTVFVSVLAGLVIGLVVVN